MNLSELQNAYLHVKPIGDNRAVGIERMTFGNCRIRIFEKFKSGYQPIDGF